MANRISTILDLDGRSFTQSLQGIKTNIAQADTLTGKFKAGFTGLQDAFRNSPQAQAAVASGLVAIGAASIQAASNLEESTNAVNVAYGATAESVLALGETSAESFGLSQRAFNEFAVQFSAFANQVATSSGRQVNDVVQEMTTRVADFASVMNLDVAQAAQVFQSALAGETEPIRRYGIDMSAAAVKAHALATGIADSSGEMTEAERIQARYSLLMQSTNQVAGDFANTSDGLANSQRIARAQIEDLSAALGQQLLPQVARVTAEFTQLVTWAGNLKSAAEDLPGPLGELVGKLDDLAIAAQRGPFGIRDLADATAELATRKVELDEVLSTESIDGMRAKFVAAREHLMGFGDSTDTVTEKLWAQVDAGLEAIDAIGEQRVSTEDVTEATDAFTESIKDSTVAQLEALEAQQAMDNARRAAADTLFAVEQAESDFADQVAETTEKLGLSEDEMREQGITLLDLRAGMNGTAASAADLADKERQLAEETAVARGETLSAEEGQRIWTESMIASANSLDGPLRQAVLDYVARVNGIPQEHITTVAPYLDDGELTAIEAALAELARDRLATVRVRLAGGTLTNDGGVSFGGGYIAQSMSGGMVGPIDSGPSGAGKSGSAGSVTLSSESIQQLAAAIRQGAAEGIGAAGSRMAAGVRG